MVRNTRETRRPCALTFEGQPNGIDVGQGWLNRSTIHFEGMLRKGTSWWNPIIWCFFLCLTCWHIIKQRDDIYIHLPSNLQKINKSLIPAAGQTPRKLKARGCDLPLGLHQWSMAFNGDSRHRDSRKALCSFADPWQHFAPKSQKQEIWTWKWNLRGFFFGVASDVIWGCSKKGEHKMTHKVGGFHWYIWRTGWWEFQTSAATDLVKEGLQGGVPLRLLPQCYRCKSYWNYGGALATEELYGNLLNHFVSQFQCLRNVWDAMCCG